MDYVGLDINIEIIEGDYNHDTEYVAFIVNKENRQFVELKKEELLIHLRGSSLDCSGRGYGSRLNRAIKSIMQQVSGKLLVVDAMKNTRREIKVPKLTLRLVKQKNGINIFGLK